MVDITITKVQCGISNLPAIVFTSVAVSPCFVTLFPTLRAIIITFILLDAVPKVIADSTSTLGTRFGVILGKLKLLENIVAIVCLACVTPVIFIPPIVAIPTLGLPLGDLVVAFTTDKAIRLAGVFGLVFFLLRLDFVETVDAFGIVDALLVGTATWRRRWRSCAFAWALTTKVGTSRRVAICATACSSVI